MHIRLATGAVGGERAALAVRCRTENAVYVVLRCAGVEHQRNDDQDCSNMQARIDSLVVELQRTREKCLPG
jgi:hypothetical protein